MNKSKTLVIASLLGLALLVGAGCSSSSTLQTNVNSPASNTQLTKGTISGEATYPADKIPHLKICVEDATTKITGTCTENNPPSGEFSLMVPAGTYYVYAMLASDAALKIPTAANIKAYYSEFVTCGMQASCPSHAPIKVTVQVGGEIQNVNPGDWYSN